MLKRLIRTDDDLKLLILRVTLGAVVLAHGVQKAFGWFGGGGAEETIRMFGMAWGIPAALTALVILTETLGAVSLVLGFLGRFWALAVVGIMAGAVYFVHGRWGFYMNWYGQPRGEGYEFHVLAVAMAAAVIVGGSGRWSVDRMLTRRWGGTDAGHVHAGDRAAGPEAVAAR